ncbi:MAG: cytosolic protein [Bacteroidetes bacterium]|uniref:Cytosolic protein n=1 Tax=Candidatus Cryptobacteroides excrementavium TaxID=2840759 RepID=A0A9D9J3K8_9BACT|nr:cytosolic protein [Candidatus Cryptobacteroides excrementavium]
MNTLISQVEDYVANNIAYFHSSRIDKLKSLQLNRLIKSKNPYLYKAKNLNTPQEIVESIASAFLSSAEESMFGDWLEGLAIFIANIVYNGYKSSAEGIDLEMDKDGTHYFISIKSGPKWSNSSSLKKLKENFLKAKRIYHTSGNRNLCEAIEGCCYGKENNTRKDTHIKLCGERFWEFISGSETLYIDIIEPLGIDAAEKNQQYKQEYDKMITRFTRDFISLYCDSDGNILWNKIVYINSGK